MGFYPTYARSLQVDRICGGIYGWANDGKNPDCGGSEREEMKHLLAFGLSHVRPWIQILLFVVVGLVVALLKWIYDD
jgi:hypothetical protein